MDGLAELETRVDRLLERLRLLEDENGRLKQELAALRCAHEILLDEKNTLQKDIAAEAMLRHQILGRLRMLLEKISKSTNRGLSD